MVAEQPIDDTARALANAVRGDVRFGRHDRLLYATDASIYQVEPLGVVVPESVEDAVAAVRFCAEHGLPMLPRGGGTSLAGQCVNRAVVLDLSAGCRGILVIDEGGRRARVEAGRTIDDLNDELRAGGLFFAPDPSTARQATVGGCIGNNAAGSRSVLYGRTAENLLGVDVALADGRRVTLDEGAALRDPTVADLTERVCGIVRSNELLIRERFPNTVRRNAGYALDMILAQLDSGAGSYEKVNLAHLICGSEGTLAVTLGAELKLVPIPAARGLAVLSFDSLDAAIAAVVPLLELNPSAIELLDDLVVGLARENLQHRGSLELLPEPPGGRTEAVLYVELSVEDAGELPGLFEGVRARAGGASIATSTDAPGMARLWALRKAGEPLLHGVPGERKPLGFIEDNAVPPERLSEFVRRLRQIIESRGTRGAFYAHASVGVLHVRPLLTLRSEDDLRLMEEIAVEAADLAKELGGVMSGEHGDGRARGPLLERFYGPELMAAFREIKAVFDPENRLNPGNIVEPAQIETIHERTRVDPSGSGPLEIETETYFHYDDQTDFAHAVEMCNGAGVCRKKTGGVMCPSYMATLDERHSTRGRGNALRLAISGQLGPDPWRDPGTHETLDLCLSCKACKAECPSNVDVARLKAEYEAQAHDHRGRAPLINHAFGHIHLLTRLAGMAPALTNFVNKLAPMRTVINAAMGIHPGRSLPVFEKPLPRRWPVDDPSLSPDAPRVVLYADTFTAYNEPAIGLAAKRVLEAFGYRVELYRGTDAGRPMISQGMLPAAIRRIDREVGDLDRRLASGAEAVLFCEPSVLSAVADDWVMLKCRSDRSLRRWIASRSGLVEAFLNDRWGRHPREPRISGDEGIGRLLLHGHCHQKALWGAGSSGGLLERLLPGRVETLDTTCCGLAGGFGYTRGRFDLSMKIGELGVLPAARGLSDGEVLVAPGTSCRHQIKDGAGVRALHPLEVVERIVG